MSDYDFDATAIKGQQEFMESLHPELLYSGAFGAGKSRVLCEKAYFLSSRYAGNKGLIVRKTLSDLKPTTMDTFFRYTCPPDAIASYNKTDQVLKLVNGSEILFAGIDHSSKIGSFEAGWIAVDEIIEITEEDYIMLLGRLRFNRVPFRQIFSATNPSHPRHWVYQHFYNRSDLQKKGMVKVIESDALANPFNPEDYQERLRSMVGKYKKRFVDGLWISFEGLIYDCWNPNEHELARDTQEIPNTEFKLTGNSANPIPEDWEIYRSIDFGFTNPFVCQWWAAPKYIYKGQEGMQDRYEVPWEDKIFVMFKEIYLSGEIVAEHARRILRSSANDRGDVLATICDHDAGDREILNRAGIPNIAAAKDVEAGIQETYNAISSNKLFILENSLIHSIDEVLQDEHKPVQTIEEFANYKKPEGKEDVKNPQEKPLKVNDHGMDAMRYFYYTLWRAHNASNIIHIAKYTNTTPKRPYNIGSRFGSISRDYSVGQRRYS